MVNAIEYGPSFIAWWSALQPSWRVSDSSAVLSKNVPANETWAALGKGGSAGLYVVIMALSWWINAVGADAEGSGIWVIVEDFTWVLQQVHEIKIKSHVKKRGTTVEESTVAKRYAFYIFK